jgi:hypothetical protein
MHRQTRAARRRRFHRVVACAMTALVAVQALASVPLPVAAVESRDTGREPDIGPVVVDDGPQVAPVAPISVPDGGASAAGVGDVSIGPRPSFDTSLPPEQATEVESARTERSRLVANPDGSLTLESSTGRLHYADALGAWRPIDLDLVTEADDAFGLRTTANDRILRLATDPKDGVVARLEADGRAIDLALDATLGDVSRTRDANRGVDRVSFADLGGGAEVYVRPTSDGLEFGASWSSPDQTPSVDIILDLQGYDIKVAADGLTLELFERPVEVEPEVSPTPAPTPDPSTAPV